ncbi:MAG: hypothetical protein AAF225_08315 [Pseudomonadota bacterium]
MDQTHSSGHRLAGIFLMLGAFSMPFIIIDYVSIMGRLDSGSTMAERAAFIKENFDALALGWRFEIMAMGLMAAGAIAMVPHRVGVAGWALAAAGVLIAATEYPIMLGGYKELVFAETVDLNLLTVMIGATTMFFYAGGFLYHLGFAIALSAEAMFQENMVWKIILGLGGLSNMIAAAGFGLAFIGNTEAFAVAGAFALPAFLILGLKGAKLARG